MKDKIERALHRAVEQLPQPDYRAMAETPVQKMEVHDYVTRQETPTRGRPQALPLALAACILLLIAGLVSYLQFFQIYSVVDLTINPAFSISLNRRDQVRYVEALNEDASAILEGRSYGGWTLEATVGNLLDELRSHSYLTSSSDAVSVAVSSKNIERSRTLREAVEGYVSDALVALPAPSEPETVPSQAPSLPPEMPSLPSTPPTPVVPTPPPAPVITVPPTPATPVPLSMEALTQIIRQRVPGAEIEKAELDEDDGQLLYEVKFQDGEDEYEAEIDALTGAILSWELD